MKSCIGLKKLVCDKHMYWLYKFWLVVKICSLKILIGDKDMYWLYKSCLVIKSCIGFENFDW